MGRLIIDGNRVYELDEACLQRKRRTIQVQGANKNKEMQKERNNEIQRSK